MADGLNRVMLLGNLGADPELRMTSGGQAVLKLRLATAETYLDRNRNRQEKTEWHSVVVWGKRAEALGKILSKGSRLFIEGSLRTSSYDDRDGNKRYKTEIVANNIILGGRGGGGGGRDNYDDIGGAGRDAGGGRPQQGGNRDSGTPRDSGGEPSGFDDDFEPRDSGGGFGGPPDDDDIPF